MLDTVLRRDVTNATFPVYCPLVQRRLGLMHSASTSAPSSEIFLLLAIDRGGFVEGKEQRDLRGVLRCIILFRTFGNYKRDRL